MKYAVLLKVTDDDSRPGGAGLLKKVDWPIHGPSEESQVPTLQQPSSPALARSKKSQLVSYLPRDRRRRVASQKFMVLVLARPNTFFWLRYMGTYKLLSRLGIFFYRIIGIIMFVLRARDSSLIIIGEK